MSASPAVVRSERPTAAVGSFPYRGHRNMAQVLRDEVLAGQHSMLPA